MRTDGVANGRTGSHRATTNSRAAALSHHSYNYFCINELLVSRQKLARLFGCGETVTPVAVALRMASCERPQKKAALWLRRFNYRSVVERNASKAAYLQATGDSPRYFAIDAAK